jgi:hypothetical protein
VPHDHLLQRKFESGKRIPFHIGYGNRLRHAARFLDPGL